MNKSLKIQEFSIAIAAKNLNPAAINLDFLKYSGVVPGDWELVRNPIYTKGLVQIFFKNGVGIVAQPNQLSFLEVINNKSHQDIQIVQLANACVDKLPNMDYLGASINPKGFVMCESREEAYGFVHNKLLSPGPWMEFGDTPVKAALQFSYNLEGGQLNLSVNEADAKTPEGKNLSLILFSGSFNRANKGETVEEKLSNMHQIINNWMQDMEIYVNLVDQRFLKQSEQVLQIRDAVI
ncbi:MAG: hypothetical protein AAF208_10030 [Cyanobacteria bacterium P01_A01_bin.45]